MRISQHIVNMHHLLAKNSDAIHSSIRDMSSSEVLRLACSTTRANHLGVLIVPVNGIDIIKKSVFYE